MSRQRQRQLALRQSGKQHIEQSRVLGVNSRASQPSAVLSMVSRACTQAIAVLALRMHRARGATDPARGVFGIEHGRERAACERERGIERFRFGARATVRRDQDVEWRAEFEPRKGALRRHVVRFEREDDLQFFARVIRYYGANPGRSGNIRE